MKKNYLELLAKNNTLTDCFITLRPFTLGDRKDIFEYASDEETTKYLSWNVHTSIIVSEKAIKDFYLKAGVFAIEFEGKCIGAIDLRLSPEDNSASFGYVVNRRYWGNGIATRALKLVFELAFDVLDVGEVRGSHAVENGASGRVMEKNGMRYQKSSEAFYEAKNKTFEMKDYVITKQEYEERKK